MIIHPVDVDLGDSSKNRRWTSLVTRLTRHHGPDGLWPDRVDDPAMTLQFIIMLMAHSVLSKRSSSSAASMPSLTTSVGVEDC